MIDIVANLSRFKDMTQTSPPPLLTQDPQPKQIFIPESPKPNFWSADFRQEVTALTTRLFIQLRRRPTTLIAGVLQPLMWLLLFGALFSGLPKGLVGDGQTYVQFLAAGIIVFTAFSSALNSGLPFRDFYHCPKYGADFSDRLGQWTYGCWVTEPKWFSRNVFNLDAADRRLYDVEFGTCFRYAWTSRDACLYLLGEFAIDVF